MIRATAPEGVVDKFEQGLLTYDGDGTRPRDAPHGWLCQLDNVVGEKRENLMDILCHTYSGDLTNGLGSAYDAATIELITEELAAMSIVWFICGLGVGDEVNGNVDLSVLPPGFVKQHRQCAKKMFKAISDAA